MSNSFINKKIDLTTTNVTTLYTVPSATTAIIKSILVSNDGASGSSGVGGPGGSSSETSVPINITITNSSGAVFSIAFQKAIQGASGTSGEPVEILSKTLVAETGDIIKVTASVANKIHVILSAMEVLPRTVTT